MIEVEEFSGTGAPGDPYVFYAETTYAYNAQGLLETVTDDHQNVTTLTYDALFRKIQMDDPDMGIWSYDYDLWGQLVEQTDARGARIAFTYDQLGRPIQREVCDAADDCDAVPADWRTVAEYDYDDTIGGNYGLGRPTGTASYYPDGTVLAEDSVIYDLLGRPTSATRQLDFDASGTFGAGETFTTTYDSLGRVLTTVTPEGETLTSAYNARGLLEAFTGSSTAWGAETYVADLDYTATGGISPASYLA